MGLALREGYGVVRATAEGGIAFVEEGGNFLR